MSSHTFPGPLRRVHRPIHCPLLVPFLESRKYYLLLGVTNNGVFLCNRNDIFLFFGWETRSLSVIDIEGSHKCYICMNISVCPCFRESRKRVFYKPLYFLCTSKQRVVGRSTRLVRVFFFLFRNLIFEKQL